MAKYRALQRGQVFADDITPIKRADSGDKAKAVRVIEPGEIFDFHGKPGSWMERIEGKEDGVKPGKGSGSKAATTQSTSTEQADGSAAGDER